MSHHKGNRKRRVAIAPETRTYKFWSNSNRILIEAETLDKAKAKFMEQYGFYPEKGINYVRDGIDTPEA